MPLPNRPDKLSGKPLLTASEALLRRKIDVRAASIILCYQPSTLEYGVKRYGGRRIHGFFGEVYALRKAGERVLIAGKFGIGAPVVAVLLEEMAALGIKRCISVGIAGTLRDDVPCGGMLIAREAIRDEGTSYHYAPPEKRAIASMRLSACLKQTLNERKISSTSGVVWSTDAPYRETQEEVQHYQDEGVIAVEMEAAALFTVSTALGMEAACGLVAADSLAGGIWKPIADGKAVRESLHTLLDASMEALLA